MGGGPHVALSLDEVMIALLRDFLVGLKVISVHHRCGQTWDFCSREKKVEVISRLGAFWL